MAKLLIDFDVQKIPVLSGCSGKQI